MQVCVQTIAALWVANVVVDTEMERDNSHCNSEITAVPQVTCNGLRAILAFGSLALVVQTWPQERARLQCDPATCGDRRPRRIKVLVLQVMFPS